MRTWPRRWVQVEEGTSPTQGELATSMTAFMATAMWHLGQVTLLDDAGLKGVDLNPLVDPPEIWQDTKIPHVEIWNGREIWNGKSPKTKDDFWDRLKLMGGFEFCTMIQAKQGGGNDLAR